MRNIFNDDDSDQAKEQNDTSSTERDIEAQTLDAMHTGLSSQSINTRDPEQEGSDEKLSITDKQDICVDDTYRKWDSRNKIPNNPIFFGLGFVFFLLATLTIVHKGRGTNGNDNAIKNETTRRVAEDPLSGPNSNASLLTSAIDNSVTTLTGTTTSPDSSSCEIDFQFLACPENPPLRLDNGCQDRPQSITFRFNGGDCSQSDNLKDRQNFTCVDHVTGGPSAIDGTPYYITVGPRIGGDAYFADTVPVSGNYTLNSGMSLEVLATDMTIQVFESEGGELMQSTDLHLSCSQQLFLFDKFGSSQVIRWTEPSGRVVDDSASDIGTRSTTFRFEIIPDSFGPVRLKEFSIISNALDTPFDYTSFVNGTVLNLGESPPDFPGLSMDIDYNTRTKYTFFGTIIAESLDGSTQCSGSDFLECPLGYNLAPVFQVQDQSESPNTTTNDNNNEPGFLPATNNTETDSDGVHNITLETSNPPPQSQTINETIDLIRPDETTIENGNPNSTEPVVGRFDDTTDLLTPPDASDEPLRVSKHGLGLLDDSGGQ